MNNSSTNPLPKEIRASSIKEAQRIYINLMYKNNSPIVMSSLPDSITKIDSLIAKRLRHFRENQYRGTITVSRQDFVDDFNSIARAQRVDADLTHFRWRKYEEGVNPPHEVLYVLRIMGLDLNWLYQSTRQG